MNFKIQGSYCFKYIRVIDGAFTGEGCIGVNNNRCSKERKF